VIRRALGFAAVSALLVFGGAWVISAMHGPDDVVARAVWISAVIAFVVQVGAFAVVWPIALKNPIAGWGVGSLIRFGVLLLHGFAGTKLLGLPMGAALLSLVSFLFVTMLVEPFFLRR
jgi:hypothetical protein